MNTIIELKYHAPGDFEVPSTNFKGFKYRTIYFFDKWKQAQIYEIDNKIISYWKKGTVKTAKFGSTYCSLNLSRTSFRFMVVYHNKKISKKDIKKLAQQRIEDIYV